MASQQLPPSEDYKKKVPNILTGLRLLAVPFFVYLLVDPTPTSRVWATGIFVIASFTDWLDGYLARLYHAESIVGKLLDPLADKILVTAALVMLVASPEDNGVEAWIVVVLLGRDILVTGLRSLAAVKGTIVAASYWAKHKTFWTMVAIVFLLIGRPYVLVGYEIDFRYLGVLSLWLALFLSISTGLHYAVTLRKVFED